MASVRWLAVRVLASVLLLGGAHQAHAGTDFCSSYPLIGGYHVIDGNDPALNPLTLPSSISIDTSSTASCYIKNFQPPKWPQGLTSTINFANGTTGIVIFDNVYYTGNMSCSNTSVKIWFVNNAQYDPNNSCQSLFIPVETIGKQTPGSNATIGVPFTYTLTVPVMYDPATATYYFQPSVNTLSNATIYDDLTNVGGASLTYLSNTAYLVNGATRTSIGPLTLGANATTLSALGIPASDSTKHIVFSADRNAALTNIAAGTQIEIQMTVVLDNVPANAAGVQFTNTAKWWFGRVIDGVAYTPLPGQDGVSAPMTIVEPSLTLQKTSTTTNLNVGSAATFRLNVQNTGGADTWNTIVTDVLPTGMCAYDPTPTVSARLFATDGTTPVSGVLTAGTDYTASYSGCQLTVAMKDTTKIGPTQRLIVSYQGRLDAGTAPGLPFSNVAGATQWYSGPSTDAGRRVYNRALTDGTPGVLDFQDAYTVTSTTQGYFLLKSVSNLTTGVPIATAAFPGDRLRYTLQIQNFTYPRLNGITLTDDLDALNATAAFVPGSLANVTVTPPLPAGATLFPNPTGGSKGTGSITISGLDLLQDQQYQIQFDVALASNLVNGTIVFNQASLTGTDEFLVPWTGVSDDPYVNGPSLLSPTGDRTQVQIFAPGALSKVNTQSTATIGEHFKYRIVVPATPVNVPLYDVRIVDNLGASAANLSLISATVVSGGTWSLSNTGTATDLVLGDANTGIDIPAGGQAVIEITVALDNTATNKNGLTFTNTASYTYNKINGDETTRGAGAGATTANMTVVEPALSIVKAVSYASPIGKASTDPANAGDVLLYTVTVTNTGTSWAYDTDVLDAMPSNMALVAGSATAKINGVAVTGFVVDPTLLPNGALVWGAQNGDGNLDIPVAGKLELTYQVKVLSANGTPIVNSVYTDWASLNGGVVGERNGAGCPNFTAPDNYCAGPAISSITANDPTAFSKTVESDTWTTAPSTGTDSTLRVGDTVVYTLTPTLREGTTQNVVIADTLPAGMAFDSVVSINGDTSAPYSKTAPFDYSDFTGPVASGNTLTFSFGNVTNAADNSSANNGFVIKYRARVVNTLAQLPTAQTLTNSATLNYAISGVPGTQKTASVPINVWQPELSVLKTAAPAGGDSVIASGELVAYTVDVRNTGAAPTYNTVVQDTLPVGMRNTAPVTVTISLLNAGTTLANLAPSYDSATGVATWNLTSAYTIPAGETLRIVYQAKADAGLSPGMTLTNSALVQHYYSLDSADPNAASRKDYGATSSSSVTLTTAPAAALSKQALVNTASIGQPFTYRITIPATPQATALHDVRVLDDISLATTGVSLSYMSASARLTSGTKTWATLTNNGSVTSLVLQDTTPGAGLDIPAGDQLVVDVVVYLKDDPVNNTPGKQFTNTANYTYDSVDNDSTTQASGLPATSGAVTIGAPDLSISKSAAPAGGDPVIASSELVTYTVNVQNTGTAPAYNTVVQDTLPLGMRDTTPVTVSIGLVNAGTTLANVAPTYDSPTGLATWNFPTAAYAIPAGDTLRIVYSVQADAGLSAGMTLTNRVLVQNFYSLDGADANAGNRKTYGPTGSASVTLTTASATALAKQAQVTAAAIGQPFTYRITIPATPQPTALHDVRVTDDIGLTATGVSLTYMSASARLTSGTKTWATLTNNGSATSLVLQDTTPAGGLDIPAGDQLVVDVVVYLKDDPVNNTAGKQFTNTANYTFNGVNNDSTSQANGSPGASGPVTIAAPTLSVLKTAAPAGGDTVIASSELVTYTVNIQNTGTAPAYNTMVQDMLPVGMRGATPVTVSISLVNAGTTLANLAPTYSSVTGVATWSFPSSAYAIPAGDTLRIVYRAQADAGLSAGMTLTNSALAQHYYSLDSADVNAANRKDFGATAPSSVTLTTAAATALSKQALVTTAAIGQPFTYRITVPATPQPTALHDVRVLDDISLATTGVSLSYMSASAHLASNTKTWATLTNSGSATSLVLQDITAGGGLDIPANDQLVVDVVVVLNNDLTNNTAGKQFTNTANYTYNSVNNDNTKQANGASATSGTVTIVAPNLVMTKAGPATMRTGVPGAFTLNVQNTGTAPAWNVVLSDVLPNVTTAPVGGMCATPPASVTARVYQADGTTPVSAALVNGTDFSVNFAPAPSCTLTINMLSAGAAVAPTQRLIVTYNAWLDATSSIGIQLTNVAGATRWLSADPAVAGTSGYIHTYANTLTNGTVGVTDFQDAFSVTTEAPVLEFRQTVTNVTTGQNPGANARPGDVLRYTVTIRNVSTLAASNFTLTDELDRLNATAMFAPGSLTVVSVPAGATNSSNAAGGAKGTGLLDIRGLNIAPMGAAGDTVQVVYEVRLAAVLTNGSAVLNQAQLPTVREVVLNSDDPNVNGADNTAVLGDEDPTRTVIASSPLLQVKKTSQDLTGDTTVLMAGDRLRYTITVKNVGTENAVNVMLRDLVPAQTTYVAGSTLLNGTAVADVNGASALQAGMLIHAPENSTAGAMRADTSGTTSNVATITFDVLINASAVGGTLISNQGFVNGAGAGSGSFTEVPSDDPRTTSVVGDPTIDVLGQLPRFVAQKTVILAPGGDANGNGAADPGDVVRYTITISNPSTKDATGLVLTDAVPANTTYQDGTAKLNGTAITQSAPGVSPLIAGTSVNSPSNAAGTVKAGTSAVITFDVAVNAGVAAGTVISNQGSVASNELPAQLTDVDGNSANGYQPTTIIVGSAQQLTITKQATVTNGGAAVPNSELEYVVTVTNTGAVAATQVMLTDDLGTSPLASQVTYVPGSARLNGATAGVSVIGSTIQGNYAATYGSLQPGQSATLRFRAVISSALAEGTTVTNTGQVAWNSPSLTASASASVIVGAIPGTASLNGRVWHDANFNKTLDAGETPMAGWTVDVLRNNTLLGTVTADANGQYRVTGLPAPTADQFSLRFNAPGASSTTAKLGMADSAAATGGPFTNGLQSISDITIATQGNLQNFNLPIQPNGVTYNSVLRTPVPGATLKMLRSSGTELPASCFNDPAQQGQVTLASGHYRFDLNFSDVANCAPNGDYLLQVTAPQNYAAGVSQVIPPISSAQTSAFSVPGCPGGASDAIPGTNYCEAQPLATAPSQAVAAGTAGTNHYLRVVFNDSTVPQSSQIYNNHIAIDPVMGNAVTISKVAGLQNVTRGQLVPYTITVNNTMPLTLSGMNVVDTFPAGFKYVAGSSRVDGQPLEPTSVGNQLTWANMLLPTNQKRVIQLMLVVGAGVTEGKYVNRAQVFTGLANSVFASLEATATVRVVPDATLDCSDVIGKVYDDANLNGYQDEGEKGLPNVRVVSARGLVTTADEHGRFHLTCAVVPDENRGSNFILKVDDRSLPSGYRMTTENPLVQRATRGKMLKFNFGAAIHRVVKLDLADGVFEPKTTDVRVQWKQRMDLLLGELKKSASVLRLSYMADAEDKGLVEERLKSIKQQIEQAWKEQGGAYDLTIETEVFWRMGAPR